MSVASSSSLLSSSLASDSSVKSKYPLNFPPASENIAPEKKAKKIKKECVTLCVTPERPIAKKSLPKAPRKPKKPKQEEEEPCVSPLDLAEEVVNAVPCELGASDFDKVFAEYHSKIAREDLLKKKLLPVIKKRRLSAVKGLLPSYKEFIKSIDDAIEDSSMDLFEQVKAAFEKINQSKAPKAKRAKK